MHGSLPWRHFWVWMKKLTEKRLDFKVGGSSMREKLDTQCLVAEEELLEALKERIEDGDIVLSYIWADGTAVKKEDLKPLQDLLDHYNVQIMYWINDQIDLLEDKIRFEND